MDSPIVDITPENAQTLLIEQSFERPVLVDFWAPWCQPCQSLMPILEKLANEYEGAFLLAKVNADEQQAIAAQLGVQSLPTLVVMHQGQPVDGLNGAQSEEAVKKLLQTYLPSPWEPLLRQAQMHLEADEIEEALVVLRKAYADYGREVEVYSMWTQLLIDTKRFDEAQSVLDAVTKPNRGLEYENLINALAQAQGTAKPAELIELEVKYQANSHDTDTAFELAQLYLSHEYPKEALTVLHTVLVKDMNAKDGEVKSTYTHTISQLGMTDPIAIEFQRKMYALLY